jgi:peptidoglycan/LPS O-acetylase OafA/YrhL
MGGVKSQIQHGRIPSLDGWRGLAILLVLIDHLNLFSAKQSHSLYALGQHGVLIFFVLSGYLITSTLAQEREQSGQIDLKAFYLRRFFRLMPAAWTYLFVAYFLLHSMPGMEALSALLFWRNYEMSASGLGTHFWSLSIEEQYYLVWPAAFLLLDSRRARLLAMVAACAVAAWRSMHLHQLASLPFVYSLQTQYRADSLLVGCAAALAPRRWLIKAFDHRWMLAASLIGIVACIAFFHLYGPIGESMLIAFAIWSTSNYPDRFPILSRVLESRALVQIGVMSYSLYLWQQLAFSMLPNASALVNLVKVLLLALFASISFYAIERPAIRFGRSLLRIRQEERRAQVTVSS